MDPLDEQFPMTLDNKIPRNRPVVGLDLQRLFAAVGGGSGKIGRVQFCRIIGLRPTTWKMVAETGASTPLDDVPLALAVRLYFERPEVFPIPTAGYDMRPVFDALRRQALACGEDIPKRHFSILLGRACANGYSWLDFGKVPTQAVSRLADAVMRLPDGYKALHLIAKTEAQARNIDPWMAGNWGTGKHKRKSADDLSADQEHELAPQPATHVRSKKSD